MKEKRTAARGQPIRQPLGRESRMPLRVVGIGCSAGGLEACEQFLRHLAPDTGMAFVVVSHLDPDHKGIMPELLQRYTAMKVRQAEDGMRVRPNEVYVIPPNADLSMLHGKLQLLEPLAPRGLRMPIDFFFQHLAQDRREHSVGIVLSGMGHDGTQGLKAIKEEMGLAMAQDPASAKYDSMPRSALAAGVADIVAPAAELPAKLAGFVQHAAMLPRSAPAKEGLSSSALQKVFVLLRARTGVDFSAYKPATIYRRVERRMSVHQLQPLSGYVRYLQENPPEADLLFRELLIGVTGFFRDPAAFEALQDGIIPRLLERKAVDGPLRVWVPGCSTGEEVYSITIVLTECLERHPRQGAFNLQVFGTDLNKESIEKARQGAFSAHDVAGVSPERLKRFFHRTEHGYTIKKEIRERVVFAPHNLLIDPPFTKLDLLCCRNVLIYIESEWQRKLLEQFHYTLNPGGVLFLGSAETIGDRDDLFAPLAGRWRIFERQSPLVRQPPLVGVPGQRPAPHIMPTPVVVDKLVSPNTVAENAQRVLLDAYMPPAVVINSEGDIVYIVGRTGKYLEATSGKVNLNVFAMAREGFRTELGLAIRHAVQRQATITVRNLRVRSRGGRPSLHLTVKPLPGGSGMLLVIFEEVEAETRGAKGARHPAMSLRSGGTAKALAKELQQAQYRLHAVIEQAEATQEELKAANEELQSNNEELQSSNEELTTSREEMQSLNEELTTVNAELETKLGEVAQISSDMKNLLNGLDVATIFVDNELRIKRYTPQAAQIANFIPADVGRPLSDLVTHLKYDRLVDDAKQVLTTLIFKETEVQTGEGRWHLMRILPYRTVDNRIDGVVITFAEITRLKQLETSLRESQSALEEASLLAESIIATVREPLLVLDAGLRVISANRSFYEAFHLTPDQTEHQLLHEVGQKEWDIPELKRLLQEILPRQTELRDFRVEHEFQSVGRRVMLLNARQVRRSPEHAPLILLAIEDITDQGGREEKRSLAVGRGVIGAEAARH